ncbi:MAG: site-2 protease family protein [Firmicutes bacterium]|nr:site-2 protease family protein [Bacillota bacterium]
MPDLSLTRLLLWLPAVIVALTFHEFAHGKTADWLGDPTPRYQGRLTLNPFVHIDPLGFLLLLVAGFGWAKPVQVNPLNFQGDRRRGMMLVALAGPLMNLLVAFTGALIMSLALPGEVPTGTDHPLVGILRGVIVINVYLALFNLIPIPPLDGAKVLAGIFPASELHRHLEVYGPFILLVLIFTGFIGWIILPLAKFLIGLMSVITRWIALPFVGF